MNTIFTECFSYKLYIHQDINENHACGLRTIQAFKSRTADGNLKDHYFLQPLERNVSLTDMFLHGLWKNCAKWFPRTWRLTSCYNHTPRIQMKQTATQIQLSQVTTLNLLKSGMQALEGTTGWQNLLLQQDRPIPLIEKAKVLAASWKGGNRGRCASIFSFLFTTRQEREAGIRTQSWTDKIDSSRRDTVDHGRPGQKQFQYRHTSRTETFWKVEFQQCINRDLCLSFCVIRKILRYSLIIIHHPGWASILIPCNYLFSALILKNFSCL